jgi:hypothetical protein
MSRDYNITEIPTKKPGLKMKKLANVVYITLISWKM